MGTGRNTIVGGKAVGGHKMISPLNPRNISRLLEKFRDREVAREIFRGCARFFAAARNIP